MDHGTLKESHKQSVLPSPLEGLHSEDTFNNEKIFQNKHYLLFLYNRQNPFLRFLDYKIEAFRNLS